MKHLDLFSGIGGFALAARWMAWETVQFVEIDGFCQKVLTKNFPNVPIHGDIKTFDGSAYRGTIDILTGGFPCQPFSSAGQRKGTEDDRHLWPEMLRVIGEVQPRWIVGENVSGLLNWNGGLVLKQIKTDLEDKGFTLLPPAILPACSKNAPHRRDRIWLIAHSVEYFSNYDNRCGNGSYQVQEERFNEFKPAPNTNSQRLQGWPIGYKSTKECESIDEQPERCHKFSGQDWSHFPTQSPVYRGNDGIPYRVDRIKSLGNSIVPQVAFEIFKAIKHTNGKGRLKAL